MNATQHTTTTEPERLWTVAQTAKFLQVSTSWVYRSVERGELPHLKLGGLVRFQPSDIRNHAAALAATASGAARIVRMDAHRKGR